MSLPTSPNGVPVDMMLAPVSCAFQLWLIEESPKYAGYYYYKNAKHEGYRLAKWGPGDQKTDVYNGQYYEANFGDSNKKEITTVFQRSVSC